jgi:myo-inositol catabolism protein IolC
MLLQSFFHASTFKNALHCSILRRIESTGFKKARQQVACRKIWVTGQLDIACQWPILRPLTGSDGTGVNIANKLITWPVVRSMNVKKLHKSSRTACDTFLLG